MFTIHRTSSEYENISSNRHTYARPPLIPTNLNTPPTSPDLPSSAQYSSGGYASFTLPAVGGSIRGGSARKDGSHNVGDSPPPPRGGGGGAAAAAAAGSQSRVRRLRNVKSQPLLNRSSTSSSSSSTTNVKPLNIRPIPSIEGLRRKPSGLITITNRNVSSNSTSDGVNAVVEPSSVAGRKRRRLPRRYTETVAPITLGPALPSHQAQAQLQTDVFTSTTSSNGHVKSVGQPSSSFVPRSTTSSQVDLNEDDSAPTSERDDEPAPLDPKIVFSKERFLKRHSRDFGHLYGASNTSGIGLNQGESNGNTGNTRDSGVSTMETEEERQARFVQESRMEGRERRRSWMLAKAGWSSIDDSSSNSATNHRRRSSVLGGYASPRVEIAHTMDGGSTRKRMLRQSVDLKSHAVLAGGPRPLSLVASQDLKKRLSIMGVVVQTPPANETIQASIPAIDTEELEEMSVVMEEPITTPRPSLEIVERRPRLEFGRPGHTRNQSSLSIPYAGAVFRRSSPTTSVAPPPSSYMRGMDQNFTSQRLVTSPAGSMHSTPPRSQIPPHLRNFSTSSTGSSLSSLGAIIGGSPGASSSSCSSGADHLGGPRDLAPEAFNFRMSVVERSSSLRNSIDGRPESRLTMSSVGGLIAPGSLRTDSRLTLRGSAFGTDSNRESLIEDKHERTKRRRARAFLVAGLKLEKGSLAHLSAVTVEQDENEGEVVSDDQDAEEKHDRRNGLVMEQNEDLIALENVKDSITRRELLSSPPSRSSTTSSRKRYSMVRREKMAAHVQPTATEGLRDYPPRAQTPLLPLFLHPGRSVVSAVETDGEISSAAASYHTARQSMSIASRRSSRMSQSGLPSLAEAQADTSRKPFSSNVSGVSEMSMPTSGTDVAPMKHTLRRVKRFDEVDGSSRPGRTSVLIASGDALSGPGITISMFDSNSDQGSATFESRSSDDHTLDTDSSESFNRDSGLLAPDESPALTTAEDSTQGWGRGINSEELARELFWRGEEESDIVQASVADPVTDVTSLRKVRSDAGLGAAFIQGAAPHTPISPSFIPTDSAGASPGRVQKEGWSKGVRTWLTGGVKATTEGEMEKGFGDGRGGDVRKTPVLLQAVATSADQIQKEKKSWRPFSVGRRRRRESLPEAFSMGQVNSMAPSAQGWEISQMGYSQTAPIRCSTAQGVRPPIQTDIWQHMQQQAPPTLLSPPLFPHPSFSRPNELYSPSSAGSFSPATPELLSTMTSPGLRVEETPSPLLQAGMMMSSPQVLSPTPGYSPILNYQQCPTVPAKAASRPYISTAGLALATGGSMARRKLGQSILPSLTSPSSDAHHSEDGDGRKPHILHGLGFHMPWEKVKEDRKGKGRMPLGSTDDAPHHSPDITVPEIARNQRRAAPFTFEIRPPTAYDTPPELREAPLSAGLLSPSIYSSLTRIPSEPVSSLMQGDTLVDRDPRLRRGLSKNANKSRASLGDYRAAMSDTDSMCSDVSYAVQGEVLPAKLFFMLGFLLGPWVWLIGGWGLSPAGYFFSSSRFPCHRLLSRKAVPRPLLDPTAMPPFPAKHGLELVPPMHRDHPDKWVTRNRWAAVVSSAVFIPAMCVGFAFVGAYV